MLLCRVMLLATLAACALSGGCEMARHETMALGNGPLVADGGRAASSSEAVFEVPEANALAVAYGRENLPESYRLDGRMNIYSPVPRLATNQWPQDPVPDATRVRYVYLPVTTNESSMTIPVYRYTQPR